MAKEMKELNGHEMALPVGEETLSLADLNSETESEMPDGLRAWAEIQDELDKAEAKGCKVYVYRVIRQAGKKVVSRYIGAIDFIPDEEALQNLFGGGAFRWRCEYYKPGSKKKILKWAPEIEIEGAPKIQNETSPQSQVIQQAQGVGSSIVPNPNSYDDFERLLLLTEKLSGIRAQPQNQALPQAQGMDFKMFEFFQNQNRMMMEKMTEMIMRINSEKLDSMMGDSEPKQLTSGNEMDGIPIMLRPFMPAITAWAEKMMMGGDTAKQAAREALSQPSVKLLIDDPNTWNQVVNAMVQKFGADKVNEAMQVLSQAKSQNP